MESEQGLEFRWNEWNIEHVRRHGVSPEEAEVVVRTARTPFPMRREDDKWLVWGVGTGGRYVQVVYIIDAHDFVFVIHARPLTDGEKRRYRRQRRRT